MLATSYQEGDICLGAEQCTFPLEGRLTRLPREKSQTLPLVSVDSPGQCLKGEHCITATPVFPVIHDGYGQAELRAWLSFHLYIHGFD